MSHCKIYNNIIQYQLFSINHTRDVDVIDIGIIKYKMYISLIIKLKRNDDMTNNTNIKIGGFDNNN